MGPDRDLKLVPTTGRLGPPLGERTDEELMVAASAGTREAFAVLVARYVTKVANYCAKVTGDRRAGEELAQDVFLGLWAHRRKYKPSHRFNVFLFTAACNRCRNHNRAWRRRIRRELEDTSQVDFAAAPSTDPNHLDELLHRERQRRVHAALGRLSQKFREVLLLRFEQGLAYADIAQMVGRSEATVRSRAFHGLKKLRELLPGEGELG